MNKSIIWLGAFVGSTIGSFVPMLWHDSVFSLWSIVLTGVGGIIGIIVAYKFNQNFF